MDTTGPALLWLLVEWFAISFPHQLAEILTKVACLIIEADNHPPVEASNSSFLNSQPPRSMGLDRMAISDLIKQFSWQLAASHRLYIFLYFISYFLHILASI
jgi:hypothetical protein